MSKPLTATARRALAEARFIEALNDPAAANWRDVAELLYSVLPKSRAKAEEAWTDYEFGKKAARSVIEVSFTDGRIVRANVNTDPGKAYNIGRGVRIAVAFYRSRIFRLIGWPHLSAVTYSPDGRLLPAWDSLIDVPAIDGIRRVDTGETFDVALANEKTAALRSGSWSLHAAMMEAAALDLEAVDYWQHVQDSYRHAWETAAGLKTRAEIRAEAIAAYVELAGAGAVPPLDEGEQAIANALSVVEAIKQARPEPVQPVPTPRPAIHTLYRPAARFAASVALPRYAVA